jgi:hypothetical protein
MKTLHTTFLLTFFTALTTFGQANKNSCDCPTTKFAGTKADTTLHFSNGKTIVLCGYKNTETKPTTFSEFILAVCGQDTIIDFWGAVLTCQLQLKKDTLFVKQIENLPTGENFKFQPTIWTTEKFYFNGQKMTRKLVINRQIPKYSQVKIKMVLKSFENEKVGLNDKKMELANRFFIASISGDKTARKYFVEFKTKFGELDGAFSEEYSDLTAMLGLWDEKK